MSALTAKSRRRARPFPSLRKSRARTRTRIAARSQSGSGSGDNLNDQSDSIETAAVIADVAELSSQRASLISLDLPGDRFQPLPPRSELGSLQYSLSYDGSKSSLEVAVISARGLATKPCCAWVLLRVWDETKESSQRTAHQTQEACDLAGNEYEALACSQTAPVQEFRTKVSRH